MRNKNKDILNNPINYLDRVEIIELKNKEKKIISKKQKKPFISKFNIVKTNNSIYKIYFKGSLNENILWKKSNISLKSLLINKKEKHVNKHMLWTNKFEKWLKNNKKNLLQEEMPKGIRLKISGRINGVMKKKQIRRNIGRTFAQRFSENGDYKNEVIRTKWGTFGLSIWLKRKETTNKKLTKTNNVQYKIKNLLKII